MAIVGWNDSVQTPGGTGAWIIRNSWGTAILSISAISYNDFYTGNDTPDTGACNVGGVSFHNVVPNIYQQIYYHNDFGWTDQQPYSYAFNHFTADQNGSLKSVSFYTTDDSVSYTVNVYEQFQNGMLGQLAATVSGSDAFEGFHTVDLTAWCPWCWARTSTSNCRPATASRPTTATSPTNNSWISGQHATGTRQDSQAGQSYFSADGTNWTDLYSVDSTHSENFAIDALTVAVPEPGSLVLLGGGRNRCRGSSLAAEKKLR